MGPSTLACPDCGAIQVVPVLPPGGVAHCRTCRSPLERRRGRSLEAALLLSAATFLLLFPANLAPLMKVSFMGISRESRVGSGVADLWNAGWAVPAILVAAFVMVAPFLRFGLLTTVLAAVKLGRRPPWLGAGFRWAQRLDAWAMPDVFLIGGAVGYSRVASELPTTIAPGGWCVIGAALTCLLTRAALEKRTIWRSIAPAPAPTAGGPVISCTACDLVAPMAAEGEPCPRCRQRLRARKPDAVARAAALALTAFALYWPANLYPMSRSIQMGSTTHHRIVDGVRELIDAGLWPFAILIFCTSIAIPVLKLIALAWFVSSVETGSTRRLRTKTRVYRLLEEIGRWSNVDVFTIAVFVPLIRFGSLARSQAAPGATAFILVVAITMLATRAFDPRLLWDAREAHA